MGSTSRRNTRLKLLRQQPCCHYCFEDLNEDTATLDHVQPRYCGGNNHQANYVLSCAPCNQAKGCASYEAFMAEISGERPPLVPDLSSARSWTDFNINPLREMLFRCWQRRQGRKVELRLAA